MAQLSGTVSWLPLPWFFSVLLILRYWFYHCLPHSLLQLFGLGYSPWRLNSHVWLFLLCFHSAILSLWNSDIHKGGCTADLQDSDPSPLFQLYRQYPSPPFPFPSPLISSQLRCVHLQFLKLKPLLRPLPLPHYEPPSSHLSKPF